MYAYMESRASLIRALIGHNGGVDYSRSGIRIVYIGICTHDEETTVNKEKKNCSGNDEQIGCDLLYYSVLLALHGFEACLLTP